MELDHYSELHEQVHFDHNVPMRIFRGYDRGHALIVPHMHEALEIIYLTKGELKVMDATRHFILETGQFHIFNSNSVHSTLFDGPLLKGIVLQISFRFIRELVPDADLVHFSAKMGTPDAKRTVIRLLNQLLQLATSHEEYSYLSVYSRLMTLLRSLFTDFKVPSSVRERRLSEKYFKRIQKITTYIEQHYTETVTLTDLATQVNLNPAYLSRFIKKHFGLTFYAYLTNIRLDHAYSQLVTTDNSIMLIAEQVGFANYAQFNKEFKLRYQQLPKIIRRHATQIVK
ncbi:helix-turn-helix domain-containing protein [Lactiplantibacillus daoliensis]|uniref:Helix-turn-helix domain-containing protein n=1 Tax=Lactiplantibacillus daoliensis TaxID=2559916 RepID=A0ABW1UE30_9LACO|nr:AraC family transcriptional regulator [Lactiplantibacillus daoliensis]